MAQFSFKWNSVIMRQQCTKTFENHSESQLCLVQQHFNRTNYSQMARSLPQMWREEEHQQQQKRSKTSHGWNMF